MASHCVPLAVCGSVFTIRVAERVIEGSRMSDGYTPRNEGTSCSVQGICAVPVIKSLAETVRNLSTRTQLSYSRYSRHMIVLDSGL